MKRWWILGIGALLVFVWWQPWRRWMRASGDHHFDGRAAIMPAPSASDDHSGIVNQLTSLASAMPSVDQISANVTAVASDTVEHVKSAFAPVAEAINEGATTTEAVVTDAADAAEGALVPAHAVAGEASDIAGDAVKAAMAASMPGQTTVDEIATTAQASLGDAIDTSRDTLAATPTAVSEIAATAEASVTDAADAAMGALVPAHAVADETNNPVQTFSADVEDDMSGAVSSATPTIDDLLVIDGVGPKISTVLTGAGIKTFKQLAEAEVEQLQALLKDARIAGSLPTTWPQQARLAADNKWDELKQLQEQIKNGKID